MRLYKWGYSGSSPGRDCQHWSEVQVREEVVAVQGEATGDAVGAHTGTETETGSGTDIGVEVAEEVKPCTRCRNRNLNCEYASTEAGSAAAMHLLHLSAHAHSTMGPQSAGLVAPMDPLSHNLAAEVMPSQHNQSVPMNALPAAAPTMTNPVYSQSTGNSPPIMASHPQGNNEAMQLPTPETMVDQQSESCFLSSVIFLSEQSSMSSCQVACPR